MAVQETRLFTFVKGGQKTHEINKCNKYMISHFHVTKWSSLPDQNCYQLRVVQNDFYLPTPTLINKQTNQQTQNPNEQKRWPQSLQEGLLDCSLAVLYLIHKKMEQDEQ